jgi:hypothetical protein
VFVFQKNTESAVHILGQDAKFALETGQLITSNEE